MQVAKGHIALPVAGAVLLGDPRRRAEQRAEHPLGDGAVPSTPGAAEGDVRGDMPLQGVDARGQGLDHREPLERGQTLDQAPLLVGDRHHEVQRGEILQLIDRDDLRIGGAAGHRLKDEARNGGPDLLRHSDSARR